MLTEFFDAVRSLFTSRKVCEGCIARDYHILTLKEELRTKDAQLASINQLYFNSSNKLIEHLTGIDKAARPAVNSVPLAQSGSSLRERLRQAELKDAEQNRLDSDKRQRKEYNDRINKELNNVQRVDGIEIEQFKTEVTS